MAYDKFTARVKVKSCGATVCPEKRLEFSNLDANDGPNAPRDLRYYQKTLDVTSFNGKQVEVSFEGTEDYSYLTSFHIDDVALNVPSRVQRPQCLEQNP